MVGRRKPLQTNLIVGKATAGDLRSLDLVFSLFHPLLDRASSVVEVDNTLGSFPDVGHGEANPGIKFLVMPLHLDHHAAVPFPNGHSAHEARVAHDRLLRGATDQTLQEVGNFTFQHSLGRKTDAVQIAFRFRQPLQRETGEGRITPKELGEVQVTVAFGDWQQHPPPELRAGVIAVPEHGPF